ncbi:MAG: hypothetical protein K9J83_07270 [Desulfarculaceae bacterium]|nr:hypothetical protein [Desulfarculaceae bacterium]
MELIRAFHGYPAPGLIIAGKMVQTALGHIPRDILFDAICETGNCLPDAVQLLTPCTAGNGWMKVLPFQKFALTLYDKHTGEGCRVWIDTEKLEEFREIKCWFYKTRPKSEQNTDFLVRRIFEAGVNILSASPVKVDADRFVKKGLGEREICPVCNEVYPAGHGKTCRSCQGDSPYLEPGEGMGISPASASESRPFLKSVPVERAVGERALHDMTQIIPGRSKGPVFRSGRTFDAGDVCRLQTMGRQRVYVETEPADNEGATDTGGTAQWIHENEAAMRFASLMAGEGVTYTETPSEGKVDFAAKQNGLLMVDTERLEAFNLLSDVICATRKGYSIVSESVKIGGTRAIPLYLPGNIFRKAIRILQRGPIFRVLPLKKASAGILITGSEIANGLIKDRFEPIITAKLKQYDCRVACSIISPDDRDMISRGIQDLLNEGAELIITTAGLSVDPDDVTRKGLVDAGTEDVLYGAPILPGAMTLLARIGEVPVIGVPACGLFFRTTSFDLLLPRILAGIEIKRQDIARLGHGGFCWQCNVCRYPKCSFGKA